MNLSSQSKYRRTRVCARVLFSCWAFAIAGSALGQTLWQRSPSSVGEWSTASNWNLGVPNAGSGTTFDARIDNGGVARLSVTGATVRRLRVGTSAGGGDLFVDGGGLTVTENLHLHEGGYQLPLMTVENFSTVTAPSTVVGHSGIGNATIEIGTGSKFNATNSFIVGGGANGSLVLHDAGELDNSAIDLAVATKLIHTCVKAMARF